MALLVTLDPKTVRPKQAAPSPMLKAPRMGPPPGVPRPDWSFSARRTWLTLSAPARKAYCKNAGAERLNVCKAMSRASDEGSPPVAFLDLPNPPGQNMEVSPAPPIDLRALESRLRLTVTVDGLRVTLKRPNTASGWAIESTNWHEALWHLHGCRGLSSWCLRNTPDGPPGDPVETLATALREYCTGPGGVPTKTCAWLGQSLLIDGMPKSAHRSKNDCRYLPTACRETNAE